MWPYTMTGVPDPNNLDLMELIEFQNSLDARSARTVRSLKGRMADVEWTMVLAFLGQDEATWTQSLDDSNMRDVYENLRSAAMKSTMTKALPVK